MKSAKFSSAMRKYRLQAGTDEWFIQGNHKEVLEFTWRNVVNKKKGSGRYYVLHEIYGRQKPKFKKVPKSAITTQMGKTEKARKMRAYMA